MSRFVPELQEGLRGLPDRPGIYIFKDGRGRPLYVGKARSLRRRGATYLSPPAEGRLARMLAEAREVDCLVTDSEAEALLLENNWIKTKRPRYNVLLRDDKTYPYLKLTVDEPYPRVAFTRRLRQDGAEYYGPYLPGGLARKAIKLVQKLFKVRVCRIPIDGSLPRPCLYYDMNRCLGPCVKGLTSRDEYSEAVARARLFLSGKNEALSRRLRKEMEEAAKGLAFERAAELRDLVAEVEAVSQRRTLSSVRGEDADIYGVHTAGGKAAAVVLVMRGGQILDRRELFWEGYDDLQPAALLSEVLPQIYDRTSFIPKEIHLPVPVEGDEALAEWLADRKGERVYLRLPSRGTKARRLAVAMRNAEMAFRRRFRLPPAETSGTRVLARRLSLSEPPRRIESFDVSTFQGGETTAALVVWEEGRLRKADYRTFNIRGTSGPGDTGALKEAVQRRYRRQLEETGVLPDLVLVDGGRPQLNAALEALASLGIEEMPVVGLAKRHEEVYIPALPQPSRWPRQDEGLKLLQRLRDEAHRFAVTRHRRRRRAGLLRSRLDDISGIGPKRRRRLLERFGSVEEVRQASQQEIEALLGGKLGARVWRELRAGQA